MKRFLQLIGIATLAVGAYFGYQYFQKTQDAAEPWSVIPQGAIAVLEIENPTAELEELSNAQIPAYLQHLESVQSLTNILHHVDSLLAASDHSVEDLLGDKKLLVSCHISDNTLQLALILSLQASDGVFQSQLESTIAKAPGYTLSGIKMEGTEVDQLLTPYGTVFLLVHQKNLLTFTDRSTLEHFLKNGPDQNLENSNRTHVLGEVDTEDTRIVFNMKGLASALKALTEEGDSKALTALETFSSDVYLDVSLQEDHWRFTGFSHTNPTDRDFLSAFAHQKPHDIQLADFIPNNALALTYLGVSDPVQLETGLKKYWYDAFPEMEKVQPDGNFGTTDLFSLLDEEAAFCITSSIVGGFDHYMFWRVKNTEEASEIIETLARRNAAEDTVTSEAFREYELWHLGVSNFPQLALGPLGADFEQTHAVMIEDVLVFSDSRQALKLLIDAREKDQVWGHTLSSRKFLEEQVIESNLTWIVNVPQALAKVKEGLNEQGNKSLQANTPFMESVDLFSVQFTSSGERFYTNALLQFGHSRPEAVATTSETPTEAAGWEIQNQVEVSFSKPLVTKPIVVRNHMDKSLEVLVVDSDHTMTLINAGGKKLWSYTLDGPLISDVHQVDVYKNNKLQYLFATQNKVYCIDRLGNDVEYYPFQLPEKSTIATLSVADYDLNKNYRIFLSDEKGTLYLYTIEGKGLNGWNPNPEKMSPLAAPARHVRARGKDFMIAVQQDGKVKAFSRRGDLVKDFPVSVGASISQADQIEVGGSFRKSIIHIVGSKGLLHGVTLNGKVKESIALPSTDPHVKIQMVPVTGAETRYVILTDSSHTQICTMDGEVKLTLEEKLPASTKYQLYQSGSELLCVATDPEKKETWFFDRKGGLLVDEGLPGNHQVALLFSEGLKKITCYRILDNTFYISKLSR